MLKNQNANQKLNILDGGKAFSLLIILYILLSTILSALTSVISIEPFDSAVLSLSSPMAIFITLLAFNKRKCVSLRDLNAKSFNFKFAVIAVVLAVGVLFAFGTLNELIAKLINILGGKVSSAVIPVGEWWVFIISTVVFCVLPAISEELFFRGLILKSLKGVNKLFAILTVSLVFSIYHGNATQLAYQFIYGVILCLITIGAKSVIPAIITHFLNNFIVLSFMQFNISINLYAWWIILIGVVLTLGSIFYIIKKINLASNGNEKIKGFYLYALFGVLICGVLIITGVIL